MVEINPNIENIMFIPTKKNPGVAILISEKQTLRQKPLLKHRQE